MCWRENGYLLVKCPTTTGQEERSVYKTNSGMISFFLEYRSHSCFDMQGSILGFYCQELKASPRLNVMFFGLRVYQLKTALHHVLRLHLVLQT